MNVVAKEQQAHIDIREKHRFAIRAIDRINGDLKYTMATTHACDIKSAVTTQKAISLIGYAAKNNIVSEQKIRDDINGNNGEIRNIHRVIKFKCDAINEQKIESHKAKQQEIEKQNQHSKDMSRGRGGMSL